MTEQGHAALALHPIDAEGAPPAELLKRHQVMRRTRIAAIVVLVLLALGAARTVVSRLADAKALQTETATNALLYVKTALPQRSGTGQSLSLPGTLQGFVQAPIAARASGYLKRWTKDIGSPVSKGELLAEIDSPEVDQQLSQAIAARDQAASGLALARSTLARWEGLRKQDVVSQQDLDERRGAVAQTQANVAAADANVQRLRQLGAYKRVIAPFSGVITRRNVDVGDLIDGGRPLFLLSQTDPLRVYLSVPQAYAHLVETGQVVTVTQGELKGQRFQGRIARTAASIDASTRTMQVEVALPNKDGRLLPGAYVQVALPLQASQALTVPTNALIFRGEGTQLAVVTPQGKLSLRKVAVGRNRGIDVEVLDGIADADRVVLNPPDWVAEGLAVVATAAAAASGPARAGSAPGAPGTPAKPPSAALPPTTNAPPVATPASAATKDGR